MRIQTRRLSELPLRCVSPLQKLAKLDKRTQRAMFELARQEEDRRMKESEAA